MAKNRNALNALKKFEQAAVNMAFIGTTHPDDHSSIKDEYKQAKENLKKYLPNQAMVVRVIK